MGLIVGTSMEDDRWSEALVNCGATFLQMLDAELSAHHEEITGNDFRLLYERLGDTLQKYGGNRVGFHGMCEFLVLRFLSHQLQGTGLRIQQSTPLVVGGRKIRPDVLITRHDETTGTTIPIAAAEIKAWPTGLAELEDAVDRLCRISAAYPEARGLLVLFSPIAKAWTAYLDEAKRARPCFEFVTVRDSVDEPLSAIFERHLDLSRFRLPT